MLGRVGSPGILLISPTIGTINPAPADKNISFITNLKPVGAPFIAGSPVNELDVLAMHNGNFPYPFKKSIY